MLHFATLFCVRRDAEHEFVCLIRGEWQTLARLVAPDLIETDLLRQQQDCPASLYLCLDFWKNAEAYRRASHSAEREGTSLCSLAGSYFLLGEFSFSNCSHSLMHAHHRAANLKG
jgi:hypothetical protein